MAACRTPVPSDRSRLLPLIVRRAEAHALEIQQDGRRARAAETGQILGAIVVLAKLLLVERRRTASERERELLELLVACDQVATTPKNGGTVLGSLGLCDCRDRRVRPYQSAQLAQILETARAILEPVVVHDEVPE